MCLHHLLLYPSFYCTFIYNNKFSDEERKRLFKILVDEANGKVPVLAGAWHTGTEPALMLGQYTKDIGADGLVLIPPFFKKVESTLYLYKHFSIIATKVDLPIMIQDNEEAFGVHLCAPLCKKLAEEYPNIQKKCIASLSFGLTFYHSILCKVRKLRRKL